LKRPKCGVQLEAAASGRAPRAPATGFSVTDLLADAQAGDILLVERVDRLLRLTGANWEKLKAELTARRVGVVKLDLPTS
jgi:hypothetical protein